jgi:hypothetical protein
MRGIGGELPAASFETHRELNLVMQILGGDRETQLTAHRHQRVSRFSEEKGRLSIRIAPHFAGMLCVVAADAENSTNREELVRSLDRDGRAGRLWDYKGHDETLLVAPEAASSTAW